MTDYESFLKEVSSEFPGFEIREKADSWFMRAVNAVLIVITFGMMRSFMSDFVTTVGATVYVPTKWDSWGPVGRILILRHERVHMRQSRKYGSLLFRLLYVLVLPSVWTFRAKFEMEAYEETIRGVVEYYGEGSFDAERRDRMVSYFTSSQYFWMKPFRKSVEAWYDGAVKAALSGRK